MKLNCIIAALCCCAFFSCTQNEQANYQVIPLPQDITMTDGGSFMLDNSVQIIVPKDNSKMMRNAQFLSEYVK